MVNRRGLAVHEAVSAHDATAEVVAHGLVPEADAEEWDAAGESLDHGEGDAGLGGRARARRNEYTRWFQSEGLGRGDLVVAEHPLLHPEVAKVLDQVEGERVVVVDDEEHGGLIEE